MAKFDDDSLRCASLAGRLAARASYVW